MGRSSRGWKRSPAAAPPGGKRLLRTAAAAMLVFGAVVVLFLPTSCGVSDAPPGTPPLPDECPRGRSLSGVIWPHMYVGWGVVPVVALIAGYAAASTVARRHDARSSHRSSRRQ